MSIDLFVSETVGSTFKVCNDLVHLNTEERCQFIDLTELVRERVRRSGVTYGFVNVHTKHTTTALLVNENEPLLLEDFQELMERWAPQGRPYRHNHLEARLEAPPGERPNGHSHARALLLGMSVSLNITEGRDSPRRVPEHLSRRARWGEAQNGIHPRARVEREPRGIPEMKVKMILPALTEAKSPFFRPIKYSLFPPLGLATLAGYLNDDDEVEIRDGHVETLTPSDEPDLVVIQVYITSAHRAYRLADHYRRKGAHVALGGLHVTSLPEEAARHADSIFLGPGEDTWPRFLKDFRARCPKTIYQSRVRTLDGLPIVRRDLIKRHLYLVPNSIVVSRGCPHVCDFCYKVAFFQEGKGFYTQRVDAALSEIDRLPGHHLYFLDDHLLGDVKFATALLDGMRGMGRLWQAAGPSSRC